MLIPNVTSKTDVTSVLSRPNTRTKRQSDKNSAENCSIRATSQYGIIYTPTNHSLAQIYDRIWVLEFIKGKEFKEMETLQLLCW